MPNYVRVKLNNQIPRPFWAVKSDLSNGLIRYTKCNKLGETIPGNRLHIIIARQDDIAWEKSAEMNLHYGELEVSRT